MTFRNVLDSDVDRITAFAIQGVESFIALYEDERPTSEARVAAGPTPRTVTRATRTARKSSNPRKRK